MSPGDSAYIEVQVGAVVTAFYLNLNYVLNGETSRYDVQDIDISSATEGSEIITSISFISKTTNAIWIIDDIQIYDSVLETQPISYIGDSLGNFNIPYAIDSSGWPYVPHQLIVKFRPAATPERKIEIRDSMGYSIIGECCNGIELWAEDGDGQSGVIIDINELTDGDDGDSEVQDMELNRYNFNELLNTPPQPWVPLNNVPAGIPSTPKGAIVIGILDTGVDYNHDDLKEYIWSNNLDTNSCPEDDYIGWNYVHNNNNPNDDHSHGTHVAGIIVDNMLERGVPACDFRILPLKTHSHNGVSNLFDVTCATYYCIDHNVNVINDSWGFYGVSSNILRGAMEEAMAKDILIVTSSGNDTIDLDATRAFPACDDVNNIVTVGSHNGLETNGTYNTSAFSNFSSNWVDILAMGNRVMSTVPGLNGRRERKTGTSMSSPKVAAYLAKEYCEGKYTYQTVKDKVFTDATKVQTLGSKAEQGKILGDEASGCEDCFYQWCVSNWKLLCLFGGLLILIWYMSLCWARTKTLYKFRKENRKTI